MSSKSFHPDAIDYAETLTAINTLKPHKQRRLTHTMKILQGVKIAYLQDERTTFSRIAFSKAKAMALKHAPEDWS